MSALPLKAEIAATKRKFIRRNHLRMLSSKSSPFRNWQTCSVTVKTSIWGCSILFIR